MTTKAAPFKLTKGQLRTDTRVEAIDRARVMLTTAEQFRDEISRLWFENERRFVEIGELLIDAQERLKLEGGEWIAWVEATLPFKRGVAHKLMAAARFIRDEALRAPERIALLPPSYSTVYEISTLPEPLREEAFRAGLITPATQRGAVSEFKRASSAKPDETAAEMLLRRELRRLERQRAALDTRIAEIRRRLGES
ncbi:MAG TPA: hypothetical protein VD995_16630 [Azospirillum sp.]|nr:hypothetical protein [Azospirillum sp.]